MVRLTIFFPGRQTYFGMHEIHQVTWLSKDGLAMSHSQWHNLDQKFVALTLEPPSDTQEPRSSLAGAGQWRF